MYFLRVFGGISLEDSSGAVSGSAAQQRPLAVLAVLAVAREQGCSRDKLVGYLWPESDQERARHRLADIVHLIRKSLGDAAILTSGGTLRLNLEIVESDVGVFLNALDAGDLASAVEQYRGPLLDGFYLSGLPEFERWMESERQRLGDEYSDALQSLAAASKASGDHMAAVKWWRRVLAHDPYNSRFAMGLMEALAMSGDLANALKYAQEHERLLRDEFGMEPDPQLVALAERLRREPAPVSGVRATTADPALIPVDEAGSEAARKQRLLTWRNAGLSFVAALAVWGAVATGRMMFGERSAASEVERKSIAVLPLVNRSGLEEDEYFTDGIHDEIITHLSKIADLKVISRTSVMEYKDRDENLRTIADQLGVTHVLEGSVRRAGNRVRITAQLIDAGADEHLWAENYERDLSDIFAIQSDVAQQIAAALRATLTPSERERIDTQPTDNLEAYDLHLHALSVRACGGGWEYCDERIRLLERAVEVDSNFALAYAELSRVHTDVFRNGWDRSTERLEIAKGAVDRALQLDSDLAEAYWAQAYYYGQSGEPERAASARQEALRLDPNNIEALRSKAGYLFGQGLAEEAMATYLKALSRDPRNYSETWQTAARFHYLRAFENAERYYDRAIDLRPDQRAARVWKGLLYLAWRGDTAQSRAAIGEDCGFLNLSLMDATWRLCDDVSYERRLSRSLEDEILSSGQVTGLKAGEYFALKAWFHGRLSEAEQELAAYDSARAILEPLVRELPEDPPLRSTLGVAYAGLGRREEAIREGRRGVEQVRDSIWYFQRPSRVLNLARIYMMVGDSDLAVEQLETLPTDRGIVTPAWLGADPLWEPLRDHPRFQALLGKFEQ